MDHINRSVYWIDISAKIAVEVVRGILCLFIKYNYDYN